MLLHGIFPPITTPFYPDGRVYLTDVGSSNGTFSRLFKEREIHDNDVLLMGKSPF